MVRSLTELSKLAKLHVISVVNIFPKLRNVVFPGRDRAWLHAALRPSTWNYAALPFTMEHFRVIGPPASLSWELLPNIITAQLLPRILKTTKQDRYDLLISHGTYPVGDFSLALAEKLTIPLAVVNHEGWRIYGEHFGPSALRAVTSVLSNADSIIALSPNHKAQLVEEFGSKSVYLVPFGIDVVQRSMPPVKPFRVITVGRLEGVEKRFDVLIRGFAEFQRRLQPDVELYIAGDGYQLNTLKALTRELGINSQVRFLGWLSTDMLDAYLQSSHVYVCASVSETFSYSVLEAASRGLPIIGLPNVGIVSEFLLSAGEEFTLKRLTAESIADSLHVLYHNQSLLKCAGEAVQQRARRDYSWVVHRNALSKALDSMLESRKMFTPV
jgi:glycosyltransferase involved in cell wall biosynthesis